MLPGLIPNIQLEPLQPEQEEFKEMLDEHYTRQTILDIILKVELEEQKKPEEQFRVGNAINYEASAGGVLKGFLPRNFLLEILDKMREDIDNLDTIDSMQKTWLLHFEQTEYENVFVHWNQELREQSIQTVMQQC